MKIPGRVVGFTHDVSEVRDYRNRITGHTEGVITLEVMLAPNALRRLPPSFAQRKVTIVFEPTPGEAAYLKHIEGQSKPSPSAWEDLGPDGWAHWEQVAEAARKAIF